MRNYDLGKLNSLTKYPSILTYHKLAENKKHGLQNEVIPSSRFKENDDVYLYEKIDGENTRIILISNGENVDYFIGSRNELLHAKGDRIAIPTGNIANHFTPIAEKLAEQLVSNEGVHVIYFESYGGTTPKAKNYTDNKLQSGRVFDAFYLTLEEFENLLSKDKDKIASWRDNGGQPYLTCDERESLVSRLDLVAAPLLAVVKEEELPSDLFDMTQWMETYKITKSGIDQEGASEGVIARTNNRSIISKLRFEDYQKTIRSKKG